MRHPAKGPRRGIDGRPNASGGRQFAVAHKTKVKEAAA